MRKSRDDFVYCLHLSIHMGFVIVMDADHINADLRSIASRGVDSGGLAIIVQPECHAGPYIPLAL